MYITETTENVRKLFEELEKKEYDQKLKFLIYIFGLLNNNQINDKNEANPDLTENEDIKIFTFEMIGLPKDYSAILLEYFVTLYNTLTNTKDAYIDNGNVLGIFNTNEDKKLASQFEALGFNEKLDVFSEIIIRYDNETYFTNKITMISFDSQSNGFDIAKQIQNFKN